MTPDKITEDIKARLNHPFLGAFTLGLIVHNWKLWFISFTGDASSDQRIEEFGKYLDEHSWSVIGPPLIHALIFAFVMLPLGSAAIEIVHRTVDLFRDRILEWASYNVSGTDKALLPVIRKINHSMQKRVIHAISEIDEAERLLTDVMRNPENVGKIRTWIQESKKRLVSVHKSMEIIQGQQPKQIHEHRVWLRSMNMEE